jgi:DNA-binding CsgD family transcriptional regulator
MPYSARKIFIILFSLVSTCRIAYCQIKDIGLPFIKNFDRESYAAGSQNWDIVQDNNGFIYFANNSGILEFDGSNWQFYKVANESVVRSVAIGNDQRIYAGAYNELGYLEKDSKGKNIYHSLTYLIPAAYRNFDEIWRIFQTKFGMVFQSFNFVFILKDNKFEVLKPFSNFGFSFYINDKYYIVDREKGILLYQNKKLQPIINDSQLFAETEIRFILPGKKNDFLIGTLNKGMFQFDGQKLIPWNTKINKLLITNQLFSGLKLDDGYFAFGSIQDGVFISDPEGNIIQHINRVKGLQNNTILSLFKDRANNLWLGLDNGISYVEISSPITYFNYCYGIETGYASVVYNNILYLGTNQGLFAKNLNQLNNESMTDPKFQLVSGTEGQVWCLKVIDNSLFCGHNNGSYLINGLSSLKISNVRGGWTFLPLSEDKNKLLCGTYTGLVVLERAPGTKNWRFLKKIRGFRESCKVIFEEKDRSIWVSHGYKGIYRLEITPNLDSVSNIRLFTKKDGLPEKLPYNLNEIDKQLMVTTKEGIFKYDTLTRKFTKPQKINQFFQSNTYISQIIPDASGNIWYFGDGRMGVYRHLEDGSYKEVYIPFLKFSDNLVPAFEHLYPFDNKNVFIGIQNGFIHYDPTVTKNYDEPFNAYIRKIRLLKQSPDSIYCFRGNKGLPDNEIRKSYSIPHKYNSLSFSFSAPFYEDPNKTVFRYRLIGYDDSWSNWDSRNIKEFTNLREGIYTFEVQAMNLYKNASITDSFSFRIAPPFYRSKLAYTLYFILLASVMLGNLFYFKRRIERTRNKEKLRHEKKIRAMEQEFIKESLLAEKEIEHLKNEKLTNEIKHKNKELANSTMHLIQKNKFLNSVKNEINGLVDSNIESGQKASLKRLLRHIDKDISSEKYWKVFDDYFDDVHQDFLSRLKEQYKNLGPKELRLCAYLRMNLSSKEIAVLMNISIRGVEVSRYRLRKKLGIDRDTNLTEYILKF